MDVVLSISHAVAKGALANLENGPVHYAGPVNFAVATASRSLDRPA